MSTPDQPEDKAITNGHRRLSNSDGRGLGIFPGRDFFEVYRCAPEATYDVATLRDSDTPLEIRIAVAGGGHVGASYADNGWIYSVWLDGVLAHSGADLYSAGTPRTHQQMAAILAEFLSHQPTAALRSEADRLGQWAARHDHNSDTDSHRDT